MEAEVVAVRASRIVNRPSVVNLRDLGGLRTRTGRVRNGLLFRGGSLARTSAADAAWLVGTKGIRTLIDLRTQREVERDGRPEELIGLGVDWRSVPFGVDGRFLGDLHDRGCLADFLAEYRRLVSVAAGPVREILLAVDQGRLPLVFSCTLGKDRTGVVACLVLSALRVRARDIASDYALTARSLRARAGLAETLADRKEIAVREIAGRLETRAATMRALLAAITEEYGRTGWFDRAGIGGALIERARTVLVANHESNGGRHDARPGGPGRRGGPREALAMELPAAGVVDRRDGATSRR